MSLWTIAWRNITQRGTASALTAFSMSLGVLLVTAVLSVHGLIAKSFMDNSTLGYDLIAGAKGGKLQLVLNTVFYLSEPVENLPYSFYQEFLTAEQQAAELKDMSVENRGKLEDGYYASDTSLAIPVCLGDYYKRFRVIGTLPKLFDDITLDYENNTGYDFSEGRNFEIWNEENGYFEAVVGSIVANETGLKIGDKIVATHGSSDENADVHDDSPFILVGILKSSGTPNDRAVFVNMEGFYLMADHSKPVEGDEEAVASENEAGVKAKRKPLPLKNREVTAILIKTASPFAPIAITNQVNEGNVAQVVQPIMEIFALFKVIVDPIKTVLLVLTIIICFVSGISILVSIYNSMSERKHDIAVMRALGASRKAVMGIVLLESILLSVGGGMLGWIGGHLMLGAFGPTIEAKTGVAIGFFDIAPSSKALDAYLPFGIMISTEFLIIPGLILLAIIVGFLPAYTAYKTDVANALNNS
ncbi:MAG: lipoprotein ABC transporter permease [Blastopirellula sp.]|nr:MAG: lipoprotein ABC transporter permease [Blastopirellula sp.]